MTARTLRARGQGRYTGNGRSGGQATARGARHPTGARLRRRGRGAGQAGCFPQQDGGFGGGFRLRPVLLRPVSVGGGLHRLHERDQQGENDRGAAPACGARSLLQRPRRGAPSGTGAAFEGAGAGGAGGLLEGVGRGLDAVADQGRRVRDGHRQEATEGCDVAGSFVLPGSTQEFGRFADAVFGERPVGRGDERGEAFADAGQGQVVGERPAGEPERADAAVGTVPRLRDRVPDERAVIRPAFTHAQPRVTEPVEEVGVAVREGGSLADGALQGLPRRLGEAAAGGLLGLSGDRTDGARSGPAATSGSGPSGPLRRGRRCAC